MKHLLDIVDLSTIEIDELLSIAKDILADETKYQNAMKGKILASLFFEPSTRTRLSFESAMIRLGGSVVGFESGGNSSASKGESIKDTISVVSNYSDIIVMRHFIEGSAVVASRVAKVPIINAGDGGHAHPTQTLADLLTIDNEVGDLNNLTIGLCGDLKYGRTVHSLINAMIRYKNNKFILIAPKELELPNYLIEILDKNNVEYKITQDLEGEIKNLDVLYMTRIQKERFDDIAEYEKLKGVYILNKSKLKTAKQTLKILHPLPRVDEIDVDVDSDPRAVYFKQTNYGRLMRMALIIKLLNSLNDEQKLVLGKQDKACSCTNSKCVTKTEQGLSAEFHQTQDGQKICVFCENKVV